MSPTASENDAELASDEELQRARVSELKPHNAPITLARGRPRDYRAGDRGRPASFAG